MDKIYYLASCDTCRKIIKNLPKSAELEFQDIRQNPITPEQLEELYQLAGSYEALFSKKSTQIKSRGLDVKSLQEKDFKKLLLDHYTFLKRPVFMTDKEIFVGNDKKNVEALKHYFGILE